MGDPERGEGAPEQKQESGELGGGPPAELDREAPERTPLGILFLAAAVALGLLLMAVAVIALFAMSPRSLP